MVNIRFVFKSDWIEIEAKGHALFAPKGKDLVCAAVSTLLQGFIIGVCELCHCSNIIEEKRVGFLSVQLRDYDENTLFLAKFTYINLIALEKTYPTHLKINLED